MRNKYFKFLLMFLLLACVCTGVYAYMFGQTPTITNEFTPAEVTCEISDYTKTELIVENTGNIDAYIRVKFVSYWVDSNNNIVSKASEMPTITYDGSSWLKGSEDTYYYINPVNKGGKTTDLLTSTIVLDTEENYSQVVEVFAEAIQSKPDKVVETSWKVDVNNSKIISAN